MKIQVTEGDGFELSTICRQLNSLHLKNTDAYLLFLNQFNLCLQNTVNSGSASHFERHGLAEFCSAAKTGS